MADSSNLVNSKSAAKGKVHFKEQVLRTCIGESQENVISQTAIKVNQLGPALKPVWKGNFEIKDSPRELAFCEGVIAHPSATVSRKAYSISKQLAGVLKFTVYAGHQFLPHLFGVKCPDRDDVALYFYPSKDERSKKQYALLLRYMIKKDFMLRSRIGEVELFVFPSAFLNGDSKKLDGHYFMWGVFRHKKRELDAPPTLTPIATPTPIPAPVPTSSLFKTYTK